MQKIKLLLEDGSKVEVNTFQSITQPFFVLYNSYIIFHVEEPQEFKYFKRSSGVLVNGIPEINKVQYHIIYKSKEFLFSENEELLSW